MSCPWTPAKSKVAWDYICVPKMKGGLGLKKLVGWNRATILRSDSILDCLGSC